MKTADLILVLAVMAMLAIGLVVQIVEDLR